MLKMSKIRLFSKDNFQRTVIKKNCDVWYNCIYKFVCISRWKRVSLHVNDVSIINCTKHTPLTCFMQDAKNNSSKSCNSYRITFYIREIKQCMEGKNVVLPCKLSEPKMNLGRYTGYMEENQPIQYTNHANIHIQIKIKVFYF